MTKLECSVKNCVYNEEPYCCKGDIMVEGSFQERTKDCCSNAVGHKSENIDVDCEAVKCIYNESCKCSANRIGIVGGNAKDSADTQCASFCCQ